MITVTVDVREAAARLSAIRRDLREDTILRAVGARQLKWVNDNFRQRGALHPNGPWRPLAPSTIAARRKRSSVPLQDTGRLRMSFVSRVLPGAVEVGTNTKYAKWHEGGTSPYTITPRRAPWLKFATPEGTRYAQRVRHPGLPRRPMLPTKMIAQSLALGVIEAEIQRVLNRHKGTP